MMQSGSENLHQHELREAGIRPLTLADLIGTPTELLGVLPVPSIVLDRDGRCLLANRAATDLLGMRSDDLAGQPLSARFVEPSTFQNTYQRALRDGSSRLSAGVRRVDGTRIDG